MKPIAALLFLCLFTVPARSHEGMLHDGCATGQTFNAGDISVTGAFSRAMLPNAPVGAGYMTITNAGTTADRLLGATTELTPNVELHDMKVTDGMMEMTPMPDGIEIPAGGSVTLAPGGLHMMFIGPNQLFQEGECVEVTLRFETAGELPVQLSVGPVGAEGAPEHAGHSM
jgi:copper(I)-binding protein